MKEHFQSLAALPAVARLLEGASLTGAEVLERYPEKRFFGFTCSYWPEELTLGAGLEPLRLFPNSARAIPAELPSFACSLARGILADLKDSAFRNLVGLGLAQTCDTMQCLGSISQTVMPDRVVELVPPVLLQAPGAKDYYIKELHNLWRCLAGFAGQKPKAKALADSVELYGSIRQLACRLDEMRPGLPSPIPAALLRAGQLIPKAEYREVLEELLEILPSYQMKSADRIRILLSGPVLERDGLYVMIEELGGRVVADDSCTGFRHFAGMPSMAGSRAVDTSIEKFLELIGLRHLAMPICPCRHRGLNERISHLEELALTREAQGVILVVRKYCEPHAWDAVPITNSFEGKGIKTLVLELEGSEVGGQERTRLQAFLENLG